MGFTTTDEIVIPEDSESNVLVIDPPVFESSATLPPLIPAPPPLAPAPPPPAPISEETVEEALPAPPTPKGLLDLQDAARRVHGELEALRAELALDRLQLAAERQTLEADRACVTRAHAALVKLTATFADGRAALLEQVRVEVAMECEARLAAQRRELLEERARLEQDLEATQRRLGRAQAQLVRSTEWLREEGGQEPTVKSTARRAPKAGKKTAPRRRTRRRF
jgi:hypothetical protein